MTIPVDLKPIDELVERLRTGNWKYLCEVRGLIDDPIAQHAADTIESQASLICEAIGHIEGVLSMAGFRIEDGKEMGAAVWRIALEDIVSDSREVLAKLKGES